MLLAMMVYLADILPKLEGFFRVVAFISAFGLLVFTVLWVTITETRTPKGTFNWLWVPLITGFLSVFLPSERTVYMAVGAYGVQTLAETESVQKLGSNGVDMLNQLIERAKRETMSDLKATDEKPTEKK